MDFILFTSCFIFFMALIFISCVESGGKEGLIFDRFSGSLFQLPNKVPKKARCGAWAIACPASRSEEEKLMKNALIVKEIYNKGSKAAEVNTKVCEETYKLALTFDVAKMNFRFGFAIYHKEYFHHSDFKRYMIPEDIADMMRRYTLMKGKYLVGNGLEHMKNAEKTIPEYKDESWVNNDYRLEFTWINLFSLRWDFLNKILMMIVYYIDSNNKWPVGERCEDYRMGHEIYEEKDVEYVDKLYSKDNQNKIFEKVNIPRKKCDSVSGQCLTNTPCDSNRICLSKWLLLPMDQFTFGSSTSSSTCSNLVTIPIWTDTVEGVLKKVDQYLYSLHRVIDEALAITTGITEDVLVLPVGNSWWKTSNIYLDPVKRKVPVPKIIFKIINYFGSVLYSAIIVIHNSPDYNGRRICKEDITRKAGWEEITKDSNGNNFGNVYVCKSDDNILKKLIGRSTVLKQLPSLDLDLLNFPPRALSEKNTSIKEDVDKVFKNFSKKGDDQHPTDEILERRERASVSDKVDEENGGAVQVELKGE